MAHIRIAKQEDAPFIALLGRVTFTEAFGHLFEDVRDLHTYLNTTFSVQKIEASLIKPNNIFWIAFMEKLPIGYAKLKLHSPSDFIQSERISQLQKIYVLKDFQSMKIGKKLQDLMLVKATEIGSEYIWLSVFQGNKRAIAFYEKNNFKFVGNHEFRIGKKVFDFVAMSKKRYE